MTKNANFRLPADLMQQVKLAAEAAGITQTEFVERAIKSNMEAIIAQSDSERKSALGKLRKLQGKAKED
jgi:predicted DNA-binding protein